MPRPWLQTATSTLFSILTFFILILSASAEASSNSISEEHMEMVNRVKRITAQRIQKNLDALIRIALDEKAELSKRDFAISQLAQAQSPKEIETLLELMSNLDAPISRTALGALGSAVRDLQYVDAIAGVTNDKAIPKLKEILGDEKNWADKKRTIIILATKAIYLAGDVESAKAAAERLAESGNNQGLQAFIKWPSSKPVIDEVALPLFMGSMDKKYSDNIRFTAAYNMALAGHINEAFPTLADLVMNGAGDTIRYNCLRQLWIIGDDRSRKVIQDAVKIPTLARSAEHFLKNWGMDPKR